MKKFNRKFIKGTNWALAGLMSFLGFSSCDNEDGSGGGMVEYGTPHASYVVSGKVTDTDGNALTGIRVAVVSADHCQPARPGFIPDYPVITNELRDTLFTNNSGTFTYLYPGFPTDTVKIKFKFDDVINNTFESDSTVVSFPHSDLKGGNGAWNDGEAKKSVDIKLKKNDNEFNKDEFCSYFNTDNRDKTIPVVNEFLSGLPDNLDETQKLQKLAACLKSCPCIIDATILCVSCVKTLPTGSEIVISFNENGEVKELNLCILMSNPLRAVRYHE